MRGKLEFALNDFLVDLDRLIGVERRKTLRDQLSSALNRSQGESSYRSHFIDQDSQGPIVHALVVTTREDNFRRDILLINREKEDDAVELLRLSAIVGYLRCSTQGVGSIANHFGETKICDFQIAVGREENVFRF